MGHRRRRLRSALLRSVLFAAAIAVPGCILTELAKVRRTESIEAEYAYLAGTVHSATSEGPDASSPGAAEWIVVYVLTVPCDADWRVLKDRVERGDLRENGGIATGSYEEIAERLRGKVQLADHVVLQRPGFWYVRVAPGCYGVGAFVDANRNYRYDDEPLASAVAKADRLVELRAGDHREGIELVIDPDAKMAGGFDSEIPQIRSAEYRSHKDQLLVSLSEVAAEGEVADLDDPRFGPESGRLGYFDIYRFLWQVHPGIYFLEPYDPDRIPVLFVYGALGFPRSFETLIANLDRSRFQPWVAVYPSGSRLDSVADFLSRSVAHLQLRHGFDQMAVVAHSMGGLVSRAFILRHHETMVDNPIKVFVSISTPWSGVPSATSGVERSPFVVPSWRDVEPNSRFIAELFFEDPEQRRVHRRLPEEVAFYLIFGVEDQTVPVASEVRWEAVRDARERWPLIFDHTTILQSAETSKLLNEILESALH